jgi:AraC-like DNA-binding protein
LAFPLQNLLKPKAAACRVAPRSGEQLPTDGEHYCLSWSLMVGGETMMRTTDQSQHNRAEPVQIWKARNFIDKHSSDELSLTKVAKAININSNHLSEKFRQVTGINFVDYVARTRFDKACDLLLNSNLRISEIAFAVGFQSLSQFNRVFKRLSKKSPSAYRAAHEKRKRR